MATVAVASWVGDIDRDRARRVLDGEQVDSLDIMQDPAPLSTTDGTVAHG